VKHVVSKNTLRIALAHSGVEKINF